MAPQKAPIVVAEIIVIKKPVIIYEMPTIPQSKHFRPGMAWIIESLITLDESTDNSIPKNNASIAIIAIGSLNLPVNLNTDSIIWRVGAVIMSKKDIIR